ncbi:PIG-L deacetylase family protein [Kineococcus esterisolvens]|uniref:PIG-L deacetylase family protein n=1 Tax=unclassified Kineococcus TaxID=2621656 RepID=UPI003D7C8029
MSSDQANPIRKLVVAPHCDDEVLGCGGLLAKYAEDCGVVVLAQPDPLRHKEFEEARDVLGYPASWFLDLPDGSVGADMTTLVGMIDRIIDTCRPDEIYLPFPSLHQDHVAAYEAGMRASRMAMGTRHWFTPTVLVYDVAAYDLTLYPTNLLWNYFESLTEDQVDRKAEAFACYQSQVASGPHACNELKATARSLGSQRQTTFAEQYALVRTIR